MYRAVTLAFLRAGVQPSSQEALRLLPHIEIDLREERGALRVFVNGEDVSDAIRSAEVTSTVSAVAAIPQVREKLVIEQRRLALARVEEGGGVVMDRRDIGTVVFPDADVKIFLVADEVERSRRRQEEMAQRGEKVSLEQVLSELRRRDEADSTRAIAPLVKAHDAVEVDTTNLTIDDQIERVLEVIKERANLSAV